VAEFDSGPGQKPQNEPELVVIFEQQPDSSGAPRPPAGLDSSEVHALARMEDLHFEPLLDLTPSAGADVARLRLSPARAGFLASIYYVTVSEFGRMVELAAKLRACRGVLTAYAKPPAEPATLPPTTLPGGGTSASAGGARPAAPSVVPPVTPDFFPLQEYLGPSPVGIDLAAARQYGGGDGSGTKICDIEGSWRFSHEAVTPAAKGMLPNCVSALDPTWRHHGTAVLGLVCGNGGNGTGIVGIAASSEVLGSSIFHQSVGGGVTTRIAPAIQQAGQYLDEGDILLIELHRAGPRYSFHSPQGQAGYIPIEWWQDEQAVIDSLLARKIIVVAAAGNGEESLDDPRFEQVGRSMFASPPWRNPFRRLPSDLGSILVGAGAPPPGTNNANSGPDRSRLPFSNWGEAVDAQGWGMEVVTSGYGDLQLGPDEDRWYTRTFCGTSSAAPMVAGVLACVQSVLRARGLRPLQPLEARSLIRLHGSPQQDAPGRPATDRIGCRPDFVTLIPDAIMVASRPPANP
jgi:hypothetical protein